MEIVIALAVKFWQWSVLITLIILGFVINSFDKLKGNKIGFKYKELPHMQPVTIPTKGKGFWSAILMWLLDTRKWTIVKDFEYTLNGQQYIIHKGFEFDGASVPKFLATFLSPVGVLLMGGLVHDWAYKYASLEPRGKNKTLLVLDQKGADKIFRDINIEVNGFRFLSYLAYWALRIGGFMAWNGHRKKEK